MAGLRIGMAVSSVETIRLMSRVKYPYNLSRAAMEKAMALIDHLLKEGIIVRNRTRVPGCEGCLRLTVGLPAENEALLNALENYAL